MSAALWLEALVAVLLIVTVVFCIRLNGRLTRLRDAQEQLKSLLDGFAAATQKAEASVAELRRTCGELGAELQGKIDAARRLSDELSVMTQSGNDLADRLERDIMKRRERARGLADEEPAGGRAPQVRSESERELLEALRQNR